MNGKVRATQRSVNKVLDYICTYDKARGGIVPVDEDFYNGLNGMDRALINQTLNVLEDYQIIKKFPPGAFLGVPSLCLLTGAFSYKLKRKQEAVRYCGCYCYNSPIRKRNITNSRIGKQDNMTTKSVTIQKRSSS